MKKMFLILVLLIASKNAWAEIYKCPDDFKIGGSTNIQVRIPCHPDSDICCNPTWHGEDKAFASIECFLNRHKLQMTSGDEYCSQERIRRIGWTGVTNTVNTPDMIQGVFNKGLKAALGSSVYLDCNDSRCVVVEKTTEKDLL